MKSNINEKWQVAFKTLTMSLVLGLGMSAGTFAVSASAEDVVEEVVVTGSRAKPRTVGDTPFAVDVFSQAELEETAYTDTNEVIKTLVPSFSIEREAISDGATMIRPASMRDLPSDKTLVLVNSKRRHRAALVGIGGAGAQGPDMATIPMSAVKSIEVLRDGAGAIYGTDAIAGTINFILKDNSEGGSLSVDTGGYSEGDGDSVTVRGNIGMPLGDGGFLSISGEAYEADATYRGEEYCMPWFAVPGCVGQNYTSAQYVENGRPDRVAASQQQSYLDGVGNASLGGGGVVQPWGRPNEERAGVFYNAEIPLGGNGILYSFGNYTTSEADGSFYYRYPYNGTLEDLRTADGSIWNQLEEYPGGFTPRFFGEVTDVSTVFGVKNEMSNGIMYDVSLRYGNNEISYELKNTFNPSMGDTSNQKNFRPGDLSNIELQLQADFSMELSDTASLAFGASYLDEEYEIHQGELNSYQVGPYSNPDPYGFCDAGAATAAGDAVIANGSTLDCADSSDPVYHAAGVGSNGFPGYSPAFSGVYSRDSFALYAELNGDMSDEFSYQAAIRFEDYSDFDSEVIGKLAGIYRVSDQVSLRASLGTGFRAPTPGQQGTTNVSTRLPNGFPVAVGLFPAGGNVAGALGATPLRPETSQSMTVGMVVTGEIATLTIDAYVINIDDRTNAVSTQDVSTVQDADGDGEDDAAYLNYLALDAAGVAGANSIGGVNWFTNAFDTSSSGVDIVATMPFDFDNSSGKLTASLNYNDVSFESDITTYFNAESTYDFLNFTPNTRWILSYNHYMGDWSVMGRASYYGEWDNSNGDASPSNIQTYDAVTYLDLEVSYSVTDELKVSLGGRNLTDEYPEKDELFDACCGQKYLGNTYLDWQGAYYYGRLSYNF